MVAVLLLGSHQARPTPRAAAAPRSPAAADPRRPARARSSAFQALYENHDGLLDAWAAMWAHVAGAFRGAPHVLGAELINEPWPGDVVAHPTLLIPTEADRKLLQPA